MLTATQEERSCGPVIIPAAHTEGNTLVGAASLTHPIPLPCFIFFTTLATMYNRRINSLWCLLPCSQLYLQHLEQSLTPSRFLITIWGRKERMRSSWGVNTTVPPTQALGVPKHFLHTRGLSSAGVYSARKRSAFSPPTLQCSSFL